MTEALDNPVTQVAVELPVPEAADLTTRAARAGIAAGEFIGIYALIGAYGSNHPVVRAFQSRPKLGHRETDEPVA